MRHLIGLGLVMLLLGMWSLTPASQAQSADVLRSYTDCGFSAQGDDDLRVGAVVLNLENLLGCVENIDMRFNAASVPKIFILAAYYDQVGQGVLNAETRLQFTRDYWEAGRNACLTEAQLGNNYTLDRLAEFMINCSDNAATWLLIDAVGRDRVAEYIASLEIEGIGEVLPYSEVDRLKLAFLDERWLQVPAGMAARFYRSGQTSGLSAYFSPVPTRPNSDERSRITQAYYETYDYNTITPHALAAFFLQLRADSMSLDVQKRFVAQNVFNVMLYTQRLFSVQALPGTVYVGSKNGFDRGLLAEANIVFSSLQNRIPSGLVLLFAQRETLIDTDAQIGGPFGGQLNDYFRDLSPQIRDRLYPNFRMPQTINNPVLASVILQERAPISTCWSPYFQSGFDPAQISMLETCFRNVAPRITYPVGEDVAMGLILRGLNNADTRFTFLYTAPDGRQYSYQADRQNVNTSAIYWFHPLDMAGQWQVDIYINLRRAYSETILVQR